MRSVSMSDASITKKAIAKGFKHILKNKNFEKITKEGTGRDLLADDSIKEAYLGKSHRNKSGRRLTIN